MRNLIRAAVLASASLLTWGLPVREAAAASVQRVQSGTAVNSANGTQTITITSVDPAKSFLIFETRHESNRPPGSAVRGRLASATTIEFVRVTDGVSPEPAPINIQWYVVSFASGVNVQRGEVTQSTTVVNVPITAVAAVNQAFVLWSKSASAGDGTWGSDDMVLGEITSTTNLQFRTDGANAAHTIAWQVVEFTSAADITVQKGSITTMTGATTSVTAMLSPAVDVSKTFVLVGFKSTGGGATVGGKMLRAQLTNSTTITIDRSTPGTADDISEIVWQAVELKDGSFVRHGTANLAAGASTATADLIPMVNASRAVAFAGVQSASGQNGGRTPYVGDDIPGVASFTAGLGIGFRGSSQAAAGSGTLTLSVPKPAATAEYDLMLATIAVRPSTATVTPPAGWTLVRRTNNASGNANSLLVYWKEAEDVEPASYAWTFDTSTGSVGGILTFVNVDNANPIDVEASASTASSLSHDAPSVTPTVTDSMIVTAHTFASSATWTPPAGLTEAVDVASETVPNCCGQSIEISYGLQSAAAATGPKTATASGDGDTGITQTVALRPAAAIRQLTLRRNNTADAADVGWFVVQFNQGPGFKVGNFTKSTSGAPASQVIAHGLDSTPKALILWTDGQTNETFSNAGYLLGFGMSDGTTSRSVAAASQTGVGTANASTRMANKALTLVQWGETLVAEADLQSWDDTNFTLNWTTNNATAYVIHFIAIGGTDVSAKVLEWTMATAAGNQAVTGVGFQPNAIIHAHGTHAFTSVLPASIAGAGFGLGAMDADGDQWATTFFTLDNVGTSDTQRGQQTDGAIYAFNNALTVQKKASWVSMDADGFTVNFTNAGSAAAARVLSLALKGVNVKPGSFLKSTSGAPASQSITGVGFQPSAVLMASFQDITRAGPVAQSRWGIGASDGSIEASSAMTDQNGGGTTSVRAVDKTSKAFIVAENNTSTINAEANLTSMNSDGFTLNWTANNGTQTQILYLALAPMSLTEVRLLTLNASRYERGVLVQWKTGYEIDNVGFHVYRESGGERTRVTPALVGGSGLAYGSGTAATGERSYAFWDLGSAAADPDAVYWLEDLDFHGQSTWHGPVSPVAGGVNMPPVTTSNALGDGGCRVQAPGTSVSVPCRSGDARERFPYADAGVERDFIRPRPQDPLAAQWGLAGEGTVKISVDRPGWYRVGQPQLVAAGLSPSVDPRTLRLYADGVEQAFRVAGESDGRLDAGDAIEFFATGVDTPSSDTRVHWLSAGRGTGRRLAVSSLPADPPSHAPAFWHALQHKERSIYFAALRNGDAENWFGQLVYDYEPAVMTVRLANIDRREASRPAELELVLQGVTAGDGSETHHRVAVSVNGREIAEVAFAGQERAVFRLPLPDDVPVEGDNAISLIARGGEEDISLVDVVNISYWHTNQADADQLLFTAEGQQHVKIEGFATPSIRVVDITDPGAVIDVRGAISEENGLHSIVIAAPGTGVRRLFAFTDLTTLTPAAVQANRISSWHAAGNAFDYVLIARRGFFDALQPLIALREQQGLRPALVDLEDVYDEFSFGEKNPAAIRRFLARAAASWPRKPRFVVLAGDATMDPRDYAGFGDFDLVPTKLLSMASVALETASDEWFVDFDDDGLPNMAIGRLPVRTVAQAETMVGKIVAYETQPAGAWTGDVTFVADENEPANDFEGASRSLAALLPAGYRAHEVFRGALGAVAGSELAAQVSAGRLVVNYLGHGSTQLWGRQGDLLDNDAVRSGWQGGSRLPFVVAMNCLNGFFHGIYGEESLGEAFLRADGGGAIAAWASSSLTSAAAQRVVSRELFRLLFQNGTLTLGEAAARAKRVIRSRDVRRSWIFFGDPATRLPGVPPGPDSQSDQDTLDASADLDASGTDGSGRLDGGGLFAVAVRSIRLADFDGDGRADLLVYRPDTGEWQIWTAQGRFLRSGQWPLGLDVQAARFDRDRLADLFLYDPQTGGWFRLVNGDEGFTATAGAAIPDATVHVADLDGDGRDDVLLYQSYSGSWWMGVDDGQRRLVSSSGRWPVLLTLRVADFTGDGRADVFTYHRSSGSLRLMVSHANGVAESFDGTTYPRREVAVANLDGDRRLDLLLYDQASGRWEAWVTPVPGGFVVGGNGTWSPGLAVHLADVTGDGLDEALLYDPRAGLWAAAPLTAAAAGLVATGSAPPWATTIASGDIDGDGIAEAYWYDPVTGAVLLVNADPDGAPQGLRAVWPGGWRLQGFGRGEAVEVAALLRPGGQGRIDEQDEFAVDAAAALAALRELGRIRKAPASPTRGSSAAGVLRTTSVRGSGVASAIAPAVGRSRERAGSDSTATRRARTTVPARTSRSSVTDDRNEPEPARTPSSFLDYGVPIPPPPADGSWSAAPDPQSAPSSTAPVDAPPSEPAVHDQPAVPDAPAEPLPADSDANRTPPAVQVVTGEATAVGAASAVLSGSIGTNDKNLRVGFLWGTEDPPKIPTPLFEVEAEDGSRTLSLRTLEPDTVYYYRAVVEQPDGRRVLGEVKSFRTAKPQTEPAPAGASSDAGDGAAKASGERVGPTGGPHPLQGPGQNPVQVERRER